MAKVVSLSVHKNTADKRRKRNFSKNLSAGAEKMCRDADLRAYAVVGIAADGSAHAIWDTGAVVPMWAFADVIATILRTDLASSDEKEDWVPSNG